MIFKRIKETKNNVQKKEKVPPAPKVKQVTRKKASILVTGGVVLVVGLSVFGAMRAISFGSTLDEIQKEVVAVKKKDAEPMEERIDYALVNRYMDNFVSVYINTGEQAKDGQKRLDNLEKYVSYDLVENAENLSIDTSRKLNSYHLVGIEEKEDFYLAHCQVSYTLTQSNGKVDEKTKKKVPVKKEITSDLVVPFLFKDRLLSVISRPYFVADKAPLGKTEGLKQTKEVTEENKELEKDKPVITKFLNVFFKKYANSDKKDLELVMQDVELMGGEYEFVKMDDTSMSLYPIDNEIGVQVSVVFKGKGTSFEHKENFTLKLKKQNNSYFIEELKHYFKINEKEK